MNEFEQLGLSQQLVSAIEEIGFKSPTPIQAKAIPLLLEGDADLVGLAQTGTGKTAAFGLPLLDLVDADEKHTQALVLAPTRELCLQITREFELFAKNVKRLNIQPVYGGADINKQIRLVKKGAQIIVATPGRLRDMINRKVVQLAKLQYVILDEADEMLNMGFKEEIDEILSTAPDEKNTWLFSATMPHEVRRIAKTYMTDPTEISVSQKNVGNVNIDHQYVEVRPRERYEVLRRFLDYDSDIFCLIFTRTRRDSKDLADQLTKDGYNADALHGDLNQSQRDRVMDSFRVRRLKVLVATDVAARGLDVDNITHVFHYNIPEDLAFYTHRSGRTARAGKKGISLILMHPKDFHIVKRIERNLKLKFSKAHIPTGKEICETRLLSHIRRLKGVEVSEDIQSFLPAIQEELEELSKDDLIKKVASLSFSGFLKNYRNAQDLNTRNRKKPQDRRDVKMIRLFINVGSMDVQDKGGFLGLVCRNAQISGTDIGKIDLRRKHSFFDVEETAAKKILQKLDNMELDGRFLRVNRDDAGPRKNTKDKKFTKKKKKGRKRFFER